MTATIGGKYLDPSTNPWLQSTYDQAAKAVSDSYLSTTQPRTETLFYKGGGFGGGNSAFEETVARNRFGLGENLKNLGTNIFGGNYNTERNRQFTATQDAPGFVNRRTTAALSPFTQYSQLFPTGLHATTSPYFSIPMGNVLGGALTGYTLGNIFKPGP